MIGTINISVNAAKPNFPLQPMFAFKGSPSSLRVLGIPKSIGTWEITAVRLLFKYPDNTTIEKNAVRNGSVWVATVAGCEITGKVVNGLEVLADGKDENGNDTTGYVLGAGDLYVIERNGAVTPDTQKSVVNYCHTVPTTPVIGDLVIEENDGVTIVKIWNGTEWKNQTVVTKSSELDNDAGFITADEVQPYHDPLTPTVNTGYARGAITLRTTDNVGNLNPDGTLVATVKTNSDLTPVLEATLGYTTYWDWNLTQFFENTYSTPVALKFCKGDIRQQIGILPRPYYSGYMWRTLEAPGFAIPADANGTPDGRFIEISGVAVSYVFFTDISTQVHQITGNANWTSIITIDGQSDQIICTRTNPYKMNTSTEPLAKRSEVPTKTSDLTNDSGFITSADIPTPSFIQDASGKRIEADLDCTVKDLTLPWTLADGQDTYTLNYDEQSGKWLYEEAETKKIELTYTAENSLWELYFYLWNNGEWQYDTGSTTTQEEDATSLSILDWSLTRSILASRKLATQTGGVEKLVEDANDEHSTRVVVDEHDNVFVQKYTTGWYVSKIEVSIGASADYTETNEYYAYLTDVRLNTEEGRLYYTTVAQDKQRNLSPYKMSGSITNYSTGEFIISIGWTATQTGGQSIILHLTITNAETPVWVNITRLVPDSAKWSGLFDTQITPQGQFVTPTQVKPYSAILGYASRAYGSLFMFGRTGMLTPDENHYVTIDYNVGKLCYVGQEQYPWELSMYNGTTFDPPIQMTYGYRATVGYRYNGRIRNMPLNDYAWLGIITVDSKNTRPCYIKGIEDEYGQIVPDNNFHYYDTSYPITFSTNKRSIETIDGVEGGITCTRQGTGTHQTELKYVAYEDSVPTKTSDLTNDSGFITEASYIQDATGNKINANLSCTYIDDTAWEITDPSSNKHILEYVGFIQSYHTWECVEPENIKLVLTYANDWLLRVYTWQEIGPGGDHDWVLDIKGSYDGDSDITTIPYFVNAQTTYNYSAQRPVEKHLHLATKEYVDSLFAQLNARIAALENNQ